MPLKFTEFLHRLKFTQVYGDASSVSHAFLEVGAAIVLNDLAEIDLAYDYAYDYAYCLECELMRLIRLLPIFQSLREVLLC